MVRCANRPKKRYTVAAGLTPCVTYRFCCGSLHAALRLVNNPR